MMQRQTFSTDCPKSLIGRVIGKNGETVKALQFYTGTSIQVDQTTDPCRITLSGTPQSLHLATSMISDIVKGTFRGFSLLRQLLHKSAAPESQAAIAAQMVYAPGFGLIPASEFNSQTHGARGAFPPQLMGQQQGAATAPVVVQGGQQVLMGGGGGMGGGAFLQGSMSPNMQSLQQQPPDRGGMQGQLVPGFMNVMPGQQGVLPPGYVFASQAGQPLQQQQQLQLQQQQQQSMQLVYGGQQGYAVPAGMAVGGGGMLQGSSQGAAGMAGPSGMTLVGYPGMAGMLAPQQAAAAAPQQPMLQQAGQQQLQQVMFSGQPGAQQYLVAPDGSSAPQGSAAPRLSGGVQDPSSAYGAVAPPGGQVYLYTSANM